MLTLLQKLQYALVHSLRTHRAVQTFKRFQHRCSVYLRLKQRTETSVRQLRHMAGMIGQLAYRGQRSRIALRRRVGCSSLLLNKTVMGALEQGTQPKMPKSSRSVAHSRSLCGLANRSMLKTFNFIIEYVLWINAKTQKSTTKAPLQVSEAHYCSLIKQSVP